MFDKSELEKGIHFKNSTSRAKFNAKIQRPNRSHIDLPSAMKHMQEDTPLETPPFSSSLGFNHGSRNRAIFSKEKINGYIPPVKSHFHEPMPENFQDFDYSFDASSRRESESGDFLPMFRSKGGNSLKRRNAQGYNHNPPPSGNSRVYGFPTTSQFSHFPEI